MGGRHGRQRNYALLLELFFSNSNVQIGFHLNKNAHVKSKIGFSFFHYSNVTDFSGEFRQNTSIVQYLLLITDVNSFVLWKFRVKSSIGKTSFMMTL